MHGGDVSRVHDVGCGVGFFLKACQEMGLAVSGNDLNGYAVGRMQELFGFDASVGQLKELLDCGKLQKESLDIVHMNDFIEHTYHPDQEVSVSFQLLKPGGLIYVRTFFVDSDKFRQFGSRWDMLMWNHAYHFSSKSLTDIIAKQGFMISEVSLHQNTGIIEVFGVKPK